MQAQATPTNLALFNNTTQQPVIDANSPVLPERSHYFDVGVDQKLLPGLTVGADAYLKLATDLLDDGQFGQAVVLTQFNYANGYSEGLEFKAKYQNDGFTPMRIFRRTGPRPSMWFQTNISSPIPSNSPTSTIIITSSTMPS